MSELTPAEKAAITRERMARWNELDTTFKEFCALSDAEEVCRVMVGPDGTYSIPSLLKGKIAQVSGEARHSLAAFFREVADGLECPEHAAEPKGIAKAAKSRAS